MEGIELLIVGFWPVFDLDFASGVWGYPPTSRKAKPSTRRVVLSWIHYNNRGSCNYL